MMMNNTCVTFGNFEFVHMGHRKIVETVVEIAKKRGLTSAVVSIEKDRPVYTTEEEKEYLLKTLGVEMVVSFGELDVEQLLGILATKVVVVGENCKQMDVVKNAAAKGGIEIVIVPAVKVDEEVVTTESVRQAFLASDFERVSKLCGHPYIMIGEVVHGKALGRTAKMPTANIAVTENKIKPNKAVYATRISLGDEVLDAVTNIGTRPTVDNEDYVTIESLILDFEQEIYGQKLVLEIHQYIRGIQKFENLQEVKAQVDKDIKESKKILKNINFNKT